MMVESVFRRFFEIPSIAETMLKNDERFRVWQINDLRKRFDFASLPKLVQDFLHGETKSGSLPRQGRPSADLSKGLMTKVGVLIDYPLFLAEEQAKSETRQEQHGSPRERALARIKAKYPSLPCPEALKNNLTKWRGNPRLLSIVEKYKTRMARKSENEEK